MNSLSKDTLVGISLGIALFVYSIVSSTNNYLMFLHLPSLLMVLGGTIAATFISFKFEDVKFALKEFAGIFAPQKINPETLYKEVKNIIAWARIIKLEGLQGLEKELARVKISDPFIKYGGELIITGYRGDELRKMLTNFTETTYERNIIGSYVLKKMADFAPGFGMLGTVIGLIIMLDQLEGDPKGLGQGLAFALITTLYGVFIANLFFKPAAEKAKQKQETLRLRNLLVTEGFVLLGENKDSILIQDMLNSFMDSSYHFSVSNREN
ncbi:MAG: MotA/TolQ/ExbB proton channel family protein [Bacteroidia bacterium]|nr:MotA/TolQ/ExbB proton channel family protein [Bacteroidia bacterium]